MPENKKNYLWTDEDNTAIAYSYINGIPTDVRPVKGESPINNHSIECELPVIFPPKEKRTKIKS